MQSDSLFRSASDLMSAKLAHATSAVVRFFQIQRSPVRSHVVDSAANPSCLPIERETVLAVLHLDPLLSAD